MWIEKETQLNAPFLLLYAISYSYLVGGKLISLDRDLILLEDSLGIDVLEVCLNPITC